MELLAYLDSHLMTEARLLAATGLDRTALQALQAARLAPLPAYRLRLAVQCTSFFGVHEETGNVEYYAKGAPDWIDAVRHLDREDDARALFARRYTARLHELDPAAQADLAAEWASFLDGTYGLCTNTGLPEEIAAKEWATAAINRNVANGAHARLDRLRAAVDLLDASSSPFAPHERARSSRRRLVEQVREQWQL